MTVPKNGIDASSPAEISQRGWRDVLRRSSRAMAAQNMSLAAAGIAFYMVWAFFPALVLIVVLAALLLGKAQVTLVDIGTSAAVDVIYAVD